MVTILTPGPYFLVSNPAAKNTIASTEMQMLLKLRVIKKW